MQAVGPSRMQAALLFVFVIIGLNCQLYLKRKCVNYIMIPCMETLRNYHMENMISCKNLHGIALRWIREPIVD